MVFDLGKSLSKATRGQAQRCNMCGQMSPMKNANVCEKCKKRFKREASRDALING
jgi:rRNA maturation endonuclease Nob1